MPVYTDNYKDVEITADMCRANEGTRQEFCAVLSLEYVLPLLKYETVEQLPPPLSSSSSSSSSDFVRSPRNSSKRTRIDSSLEKKSESTIQQLQMTKISATNFFNRLTVLLRGDVINDQCACSILRMLERQIDKDMPDIYEAFDVNFGKGSLWNFQKVVTGFQLLMSLSSSSSTLSSSSSTTTSSSVIVESPLPLSHDMAILEFLKYMTDNFYCTTY